MIEKLDNYLNGKNDEYISFVTKEKARYSKDAFYLKCNDITFLYEKVDIIYTTKN